MVDMADINTFKELLLVGLKSLEERRRTNTPGPTRDEVIGRVEADIRNAGLQPWQLYLNILADTRATSGYRRTAVNQLHNPAKVPESAAQEIGAVVVAVMQEQSLDYNLGQQTVMAASILREYAPVTPMLPISRTSIDSYFIPFVEQPSTPRQGQSQSEATLGHVAHMLASIARFTVVHSHAYDGLLALRLNDFHKALAVFKEEGNLDEQQRGFYAIVHPMEHLAELMDQGTMTRDRGLIKLIVGKGVVSKFDSLLEQRAALGIEWHDVPRYIKQRDGFLAAAKEMAL